MRSFRVDGFRNIGHMSSKSTPGVGKSWNCLSAFERLNVRLESWVEGAVLVEDLLFELRLLALYLAVLVGSVVFVERVGFMSVDGPDAVE